MESLDLSRYRVLPDKPVDLRQADPADTALCPDKGDAERRLEANRERLDELQERLYAEAGQSLLLVLQAMDTAGKDSTIGMVASGLNPQGVQVRSFKAPTSEERSHDFLWRVHAHAPAVGMIGIWNRSHYEDVLIARVHGLAPPALIERRYAHINDFERMLADHGTRIVKVFLHIGKEYQLERLRRRLQRPDKHWKFDPGDLAERERWDEYMEAYGLALARCSTEQAPWYVVPAERKWYRGLLVSELLRAALEDMNPRFPPPKFDPADFPPDQLR